MTYEDKEIFTNEQKNFTIYNETSGESQLYKYPRISVDLQLSRVQRQYERKSYDFISLLADFGGFNDGLLLIASSFMYVYSKAMF